jgi:hypothetical protein
MKKPLTKSDLCWVLVKLAGVWLVYTGIASICGSTIIWFSMGDLIESIPSARRGPVYSPMKVLLYSSLMPLGLGIYLLKSGTMVYRWLMAIPVGARDHESCDSFLGTSLAGDEIETFKAWVKENPEMAGRETIDQIALFRDAQRKGTGSGSHSH